MRSVAEVLAPTIAQENPNATIEERLEILDKLVRQNNPHLFQNPKRNEPNKVQSVNRNNAVATKTDIKKNYTFKDLNPADQRDFRVFEDMKFGLSQKPNETNDDFQKRVITEKQKLLNEYVSSYKE